MYDNREQTTAINYEFCMETRDIIRLHLENQGINKRSFTKPHDVISWFGAMQAQDYYASLWAIGVMMKKAMEDDIEKAISDRIIVRTWSLRGTLHFVAASDVRWMLKLLTPRVIAGCAGHFLRLGIDDNMLWRSKDLIFRALSGGNQLIRSELYNLLQKSGIPTSNQRGMQILWRLALDGLICLGPRRGKQHTFVLLDEWISKSKILDREEALSELSKRYFQSHGPATVHDFSWWSGLTIADAKETIAMIGNELARRSAGSNDYWFTDKGGNGSYRFRNVHLLPNFDEYLVAYKDRSHVLNPGNISDIYTTNGIFNPTIVSKGQVIGIWKRTLGNQKIIIQANPFKFLSKTEEEAVSREARRYGKFLGQSVEIHT